MKLSEDLKKWRAERPDEWTMGRFIKAAEKMETICDEWFSNPMIQEYAGANHTCMFCGTTRDRSGGTNHSVSDCPHMKWLDITG